MIRIHLPATAAERVSFAYSPLFEAVLSLHVLVEPTHHALQQAWVRRMRELPARLRREIQRPGLRLSGLYPAGAGAEV